jgi:hypothetical protein
MAVEPYIDVVVEPGKELAWKYTYDYYTPATAEPPGQIDRPRRFM